MPHNVLNLTRTPDFHKSKDWHCFLPASFNVVLLVLCLFAVLVMITGCAVKDTRPFPQETGELSVEIQGFRNDDGEAIVSLFSVPGGFPEDTERAWQNRWVNIVSGRTHVRFTAVPYGKYALSVLHDEDADGQMKTIWLGQPLEGFGFSGRPEYNFGPPDFADASFLLVSATRKVVVWMRYDTLRKSKQGERRSTQDGKL